MAEVINIDKLLYFILVHGYEQPYNRTLNRWFIMQYTIIGMIYLIGIYIVEEKSCLIFSTIMVVISSIYIIKEKPTKMMVKICQKFEIG